MEDATCQNCNATITTDENYCSNCGQSISGRPDNNLERSAESEPNKEEDSDSTSGVQWTLLITSVLMSFIASFFAVWATLTINISGIAFLVVFIGTTYFLYQKQIPSEAVGSGLYITALLMILTPLLFYFPRVFQTSEAQTTQELGGLFGNILGLVIWGFVFFLFAIVTAAIGYFFKTRAKKKLSSD